MADMNRFINNDGFEEWTTTDADGNAVHCYANKFREIHTKIPVCSCGSPMEETDSDEWICPICKSRVTEDDINHRVDFDEYDDQYASGSLGIEHDYGEFRYDDGRGLVVGVPSMYDFYRRHTPKNL